MMGRYVAVAGRMRTQGAEETTEDTRPKWENHCDGNQVLLQKPRSHEKYDLPVVDLEYIGHYKGHILLPGNRNITGDTQNLSHGLVLPSASLSYALQVCGMLLR